MLKLVCGRSQSRFEIGAGAFDDGVVIYGQQLVQQAIQSGNCANSLGDQFRVARVIAVEFVKDDVAPSWPLQQATPQIHGPQSVQLGARHKRAAAVDITHDDRRTAGQSFESATPFRKNQVVLWQEVFG